MIEVKERTFRIGSKLQGVVLDWAGTTVDYGSRAPVLAILAAFEQAGVPVTESEARKPMGRAKRDHLEAMLAQPEVAARWFDKKGGAPSTEEVDTIYDHFLVLQTECVVEYSAVLPGTPEAIAECRELGLKIGSSTGYPRHLLERVAERACDEGYKPDLMLAAEDVVPGRPAPWLCIENAKQLGVESMSAILKVDDTPAGVTAGRNAGAWSVGVVQTGNEVGLSQSDLESLSDDEREALLKRARQSLILAGAHFLIDSIKELPAVVALVNEKLAKGETP